MSLETNSRGDGDAAFSRGKEMRGTRWRYLTRAHPRKSAKSASTCEVAESAARNVSRASARRSLIARNSERSFSRVGSSYRDARSLLEETKIVIARGPTRQAWRSRSFVSIDFGSGSDVEAHSISLTLEVPRIV